MRLPSWRTQLLAFVLLAILVPTLFPAHDAQPRRWFACIVCGEDGMADVLVNVILFVPLGVALAMRPRRLPQCVVLAALLSASIELAQLFIPGRDSSAGDVMSNTIGGTLGAILVRTAPTWMLPAPDRAGFLSRTAALVATGMCLVTGVLMTPASPASSYWGQWTPNLGHLKWYRGRVREATIGALPIPHARLPNSLQVRELLRSPRGFSLQVRAVAGPRTLGLAPLFAIHDDRQREIILLGPDRDDLVFRVRTRAAALRLDRPDIRFAGGMRDVTPGDTLDVTVTGARGAYRIVLNGRSTSGLGQSVGHGWALLMYPETLPARLKGLLGAMWVGALFLPAGFWMRTRGDAAWTCAALIAGLAGTPALTPLVATPAFQWAAAVAGLVAGAALHIGISRNVRSMPGQTGHGEG